MRNHARELKPLRGAGRANDHRVEKAGRQERSLGTDLFETAPEAVAKERGVFAEFHNVGTTRKLTVIIATK